MIALAGPRALPAPMIRTLWPAYSVADSESTRRRKLAIRVGQSAMAFMILAASLGSWFVSRDNYSALQGLALGATALAFIGWNLFGTRELIRIILAEQPASGSSRLPNCGAGVYFLLQVLIAAGLYWMADRGRILNLIWVLLLPPVAYAVFLLRWRGIATISGCMMMVFVASASRWHELSATVYAAVAFSFAILFTIVFALLAVYSERSRGQVQTLAAELAAANERLREYAMQAEELSAARERNRIAREIHDTLGHYLTVANVQLNAAKTLWTDHPERAWEAVGKAQSLTREGLQDVRRSVASLRSSPLENCTLTEAVANFAEKAATTDSVTTVVVRGRPRPLTPQAELSLYRAAQEGWTNARRHAAAKQIVITLDYAVSNSVTLRVADDGLGAAEEAVRTGFGLLGLRERAQLLGGRFSIETQAGAGFTLHFEVPG